MPLGSDLSSDVDPGQLHGSRPDESNKENSGPTCYDSHSTELDTGQTKSAPTPSRSTVGRIVEMFSPVKSGYNTELLKLQCSYQELIEERQQLLNELQLVRDRFEAERKSLIDGHLKETRQMEQQLNAAQDSIADLNRQLESERQNVTTLVDYMNMTEQLVQWCQEEFDTKASLQSALQAAHETVEATVREFHPKASLSGPSEEESARFSSLDDRMASLVLEANSEISDLRHTIFELEACLEQEQTQAAEFQQCIHTMEDDILELQVQRDQAIEELKKCPSIADLELSRAEAELIATECMVELAVARESLEQATHTVLSLNQQFSDMHSEFTTVSNYAESLEQRMAELVRESESWREKYFDFVQDRHEREESHCHHYSRAFANSIMLLQQVKCRLQDEMRRRNTLKHSLFSLEDSLEASNQDRLRLQEEIQEARHKILLLSKYVSTLESVIGSVAEHAKDVIDYRFTDFVASDQTDHVRSGGGSIVNQF